MLRPTASLAAVLLAATVAAAAAPSASPDPKSLLVADGDQTRARELVQKLGSEQYAEREAAEQALAEMGRLARAALLDAVNNDASPEVRTRCQGLLPRATSLEMKARLEVFLADTDGKFDHDLAGWTQFRELVRTTHTVLGFPVRTDPALDGAARTMFAELVASPANRHLLFAIGGQQAELGSLAAARQQELYSQKYPRAVFVAGGVVRPPAARRDPSLADVVTLLLAQHQAGASFVPPRSAPISVLVTSAGLNQAINTGDARGRVCRAVLTAWFETRQDPMDQYNAMTLAGNLGMPEVSCDLATRLLRNKAAVASYRSMAATTLVRSGTKAHLPALEDAMDDKAVVFTVRRAAPGKPGEIEANEIQLRDLALVVGLLITQQNPTDYGFVDQYGKGVGAGGANFNYTRFFIPEAKRDEAQAKWKEWRAKAP